MWLSVFFILLCISFIGYIIVYKPEKLEILDHITSGDMEHYTLGFAKPVDTSKPQKKKKKAVKYDPPECLMPHKGPDDLEKPKAYESGMKFKNEERCREILENLYPGYEFPSVRPKWLTNPVTNRSLELDMYCHELRIACEYDGAQHYKKTKFHKSKKDVIYQFRKDEWKTKKCQELGIALVRVPFWVLPENLENYIREMLIKAGKLDKEPSN